VAAGEHGGQGGFSGAAEEQIGAIVDRDLAAEGAGLLDQVAARLQVDRGQRLARDAAVGAAAKARQRIQPGLQAEAIYMVLGPLGGRDGWFGPFLESAGIQVIFATPGIIMATAFVSLPLVIREVIPVLEEIGTEQEQAAASLGASSWQTFWRITLPGIKWAVIYGVVLTLARSLGEFGAVKVVSGNVLGQTRTATLAVEEKYLNFDQQGAYAVAFLLASVSVVCILIVFVLRARGARVR
jgi:ABC-type molybdate transport system permease subunit